MSLDHATIAAALRVPSQAVEANWPLIVAALAAQEIDSHLVQVAAAATVGTEVPRFQPISEIGGPAYFTRLYEGRRDLGNDQPGDGFRFRGRGFVQITGRANYDAAGQALGLDLVGNPDAALEPEIAAPVLAWYFRTHRVHEAANDHDWPRVRRRVNGGLNGWERFKALVEALHG